MNFQWYALTEQLQQHPDLLDDELQADVAAMSALGEVQSSPTKEQDLLKRLQAQLGNHGLQQLLSGTTANEQLQTMPATTAETTLNVAREVAAQKSEQSAAEIEPVTALEAPVAEKPVVEKPGGEHPIMVEPPVINEMLEQKAAGPALKNPIAPEPVNVDSRKQMQNLLRQTLSRLPALDGSVITQLAALYDQQSSAIQADIIDTLVARSRALPEPARDKLVAAIRTLSGAVAGSALISSLLARLLAVVPAKPAPVVAPEAPEE